MSKPHRYSVAAVVRRPVDGRFLAVRRPLDDDDRLAGLWGLPAVTLREGELPEEGLARVGTEKLGVELHPVRLVGIDTADRGEYRLFLMDIEAEAPRGDPDVHAATTTATRYVDQRWTDDLGLLTEAARQGSLCCRILIESAARAP